MEQYQRRYYVASDGINLAKDKTEEEITTKMKVISVKSVALEEKSIKKIIQKI